MKRIRVVVTQEDIDLGKPGQGDQCALGRAVQRIFPAAHVTRIEIQPSGLRSFLFGPPPDAIPLTKTAKRFISRFDDGKPVKPTVFVFQAPDA